MRTLVIAALFLAACGDDSSSIHDVTDCASAWSVDGATKCERACEQRPANQDGEPVGGPTSRMCISSYESYAGPATGSLEMCRAAKIEIDGQMHEGCCVPTGGTVLFWECCRNDAAPGFPDQWVCPE
jgi:hypothetical protein